MNNDKDEISEQKIIDLFTKIFNRNIKKSVLLKSGEDDCSILKIITKKKNFQIICSTDMLHRKTDFPKSMTYFQIGWMSFSVNLSDIASMGCLPVGYLFSIGIPSSIKIKQLESIANGMELCSNIYSTPIIGGDTDIHDELTISGTIIGKKCNKIIKRKGAKTNDFVCITGFPGLSGLAYYILKNKFNLKKYNSLYNHLYIPVPRIKEGYFLSKFDIATSMIDTSDSLAQSLYKLSRMSNVGFEIYEDQIPISNITKDIIKEINKNNINSKNLNLLDFILYNGGDFELLFTINPKKLNLLKIIENKINNYYNKKLDSLKYKILSHKYPLSINIIGKVLHDKNEIYIINNNGKKKQIFEHGYNPFKRD